MTILAVTGMAREARVAAGRGVTVLIGGGNGALLREKLEHALEGVHGIISIGIAGGLMAKLKPGDVLIASKIVSGREEFVPDAAWSARMQELLPHAMLAPLAGVDTIVATTHHKTALFSATGAHAADMELHFVARVAARRGIPFAVLRTIADAADSDLPPLVSRALGADGRVNYGAVMSSLMARPGQISALIRTARELNAAFAALLRCRRALGPRLAGPDGREPLLDMR